jgi:hypothetical protein
MLSEDKSVVNEVGLLLLHRSQFLSADRIDRCGVGYTRTRKTDASCTRRQPYEAGSNAMKGIARGMPAGVAFSIARQASGDIPKWPLHSRSK